MDWLLAIFDTVELALRTTVGWLLSAVVTWHTRFALTALLLHIALYVYVNWRWIKQQPKRRWLWRVLYWSVVLFIYTVSGLALVAFSIVEFLRQLGIQLQLLYEEVLKYGEQFQQWWEEQYGPVRLPTLPEEVPQPADPSPGGLSIEPLPEPEVIPVDPGQTPP
jgi:hypothetical protein